MNEPVSHKLAKFLKEKGFNGLCRSRYWVGYENEEHLQEDCINANWNNYDDSSTTYYSAPTISQVVMWIYKKYGVWINAQYMGNEIKFTWSIDVINEDNLNDTSWTSYSPDEEDKISFDSPEKAYEAAFEFYFTELNIS